MIPNPFIKVTFSIAHNFMVTRRLFWQISDPPRRYGVDTSMDVTVRTGVSEVRRHSVENTLSFGLDANANVGGDAKAGKMFGLSASVKQQLKITDETSNTWTTESTVKTSQNFKAHHSNKTLTAAILP